MEPAGPAAEEALEDLADDALVPEVVEESASPELVSELESEPDPLLCESPSPVPFFVGTSTPWWASGVVEPNCSCSAGAERPTAKGITPAALKAATAAPICQSRRRREQR